MLETKVAQDLIESSSALLTKTAEIQKEIERIPGLEREKKEASDLAARLSKEASEQKTAFRQRAEQTAETLAKLGFRVDKDNFVRSVDNDPLGLFAVIEKIASETMVPQQGVPDAGTTAAEAGDPLYNFAMGNG